ncbi:MAG: TAXI family TRAP transporter solute-binding subunit, partial [Candidatus Electrothrix sp. AR4]|nr:TAXI family TRAP transporter solute-binding subunit [Candidatus Electrothrix sp. AR4]
MKILKYNVSAIVAVFSFFFTIYAVEAAVDMGIVTGGTKGTYIQIGYDISRLLKEHSVNLTVYPSNGSLDNIADVYERKDVQLGIVQSDTLAFIRSSADTNLIGITEKSKIIFPLYNEEMHVLASRSINSLADLEGKKIAIGSEGSGTALTTSLLLEIAGVSPAEIRYAGGKKALMLLRSKVIDAMFHISGYPVTLFSNIFTEELHLVPIKALKFIARCSTAPARKIQLNHSCASLFKPVPAWKKSRTPVTA